MKNFKLNIKILKFLVIIKLLRCNDDGWHRHYYMYLFQFSKRIYIESLK